MVTTFPQLYPSFTILPNKINTYYQQSYQLVQTNPSFFIMRKLARFDFIRNWIFKLFKLQKRAASFTEYNNSIYSKQDVDRVVSSLEKDGYGLGINLPDDILQELLKFALHSTCYGDRNPKFAFRYKEKEQVEAKIGKQFKLGSYLENMNICPAFKKLKNDPGLLAIAARYLGTDPQYVGSELWWSYPVAATQFEQLQSAQVFHVDIDDYRCVKFFFYLTDVDSSSGAHVYIRGTHKNKKFLHQLLGERCASIDDGKLVDCYGAENVVTITEKAGFGFVGDPFCFHKGNLPRTKERLMLQIEFAANHYGDIRNLQSIQRAVATAS